jgi:hypothetical protein
MPSDAMSELYPIIRRQRRPLIIEVVPLIPTKSEPVQPVVKTPQVEPADKPKDDDAKSISPSKTP